MFEAVELGRKVSKKDYAEAVLQLRTKLLTLQRNLKGSNVPVFVLIAGVEGSGKARVVDRLSEWLDVRGLEIHTFGRLSDEEADRPEFWRFWRTMPARGRIGIFLGSWYTQPIISRVMDDGPQGTFDRQLHRIVRLERMLVEDGALILKFWLHLSKKEQKRRLNKLEADKQTRWRVTKKDWQFHKRYDAFARICEAAIRETDTALAPWFLVEAADSRYRDLTIAQTIAHSLEQRLEHDHSVAWEGLPPVESIPPRAADLTILDKVSLDSEADAGVYKRQLDALQEEVGFLTRRAYEQKRSTVLVFEGWDAAGKGGAIRRVASAVDARIRRVISIAAPTDEERAQHYLWRFWRHLPRAGRVTIYDRSWYGRVLVERVEGFASEAQWKRSFREINEFEEQLVEHGVVLLKFFIHISKDEQLRRFKEREQVEYKRHKITEEDWRNREKWGAYEEAINEMVARTSTGYAPWSLIPGNNKRFARLEVLRALCERLRAQSSSD